MATEDTEIEELEPEPAAEPVAKDGAPQIDLEALDDGPDDKPSRKSRRQSRLEQLADQKAQERTAALERELSELRGTVQGLRQQPQPQQIQRQDDNPYEAQAEGVWKQQQMIIRTLQTDTTLTEAQRETMVNDWRKLSRQLRRLEDKADGVGEQRQAQGPSTQEIEHQILRAEFSDVFGDPALVLEAEAEMVRLVQKRRKPVSLATAREAATAVRARYGKPTSQPSDAGKNKYASTSAQAGATAGGSRMYTPSPAVLNTARAYTSHLSNLTDEQRVQKWVKDVGRPNGLVGG